MDLVSNHPFEELIGKLREVEILPGQAGTTSEACRRIAVSAQIYHRWRMEYGGLKTNQARQMKVLEREISSSAVRQQSCRDDCGQIIE